jgi:hypothetical protein
MSKQFFSIWNKLRIEEITAIVVAMLFFLLNIVIFPESLDLRQGFLIMVRYFTFGSPYFKYFFFVVYCVLIFKFIVALVRIGVCSTIEKRPPLLSEIFALLTAVFKPFRILAPLVFVPNFAYTFLANMSVSLRFDAHDQFFLVFDHAITGFYFFFDLSRLITMPEITNLLFIFYTSLTLAFPFLFLVLFFRKNPHTYREALIAYMLSLVIAYPFFALLPCQDPHNYFTRNLRGDVFEKDISTLTEGFQPTATLQKHLDTISKSETMTTRYNAVPISCFPSMHAVWGMLIVYYLAHWRRRTLFLAMPWCILMLFGGLMLGQHYLVDYVASIPAVALSIYVARKIMQRWGNLGTPLR